MKGKSFTLIELMVVVAVIALVASIVLVSLSRARAGARDARIILDLRQVKTIALLINSDYGSYTNLCDPVHTLNQTAPSPHGDQLKAIEDDLFEQAGLNPWAAKCCLKK